MYADRHFNDEGQPCVSFWKIRTLFRQFNVSEKSYRITYPCDECPAEPWAFPSALRGHCYCLRNSQNSTEIKLPLWYFSRNKNF